MRAMPVDRPVHDEWRAVDDLSLVAFMRGDHRKALIEHGITTLAQLGGFTAEDLPREIGWVSRERLVQLVDYLLPLVHRTARACVPGVPRGVWRAAG